MNRLDKSTIRGNRDIAHKFLTGVAVRSCRSLSQRVLVELAILHDDPEVIVRVFDELQIFKRVTVHEDQVRIGAFFHDTQFAGIGVTRTRQF